MDDLGDLEDFCGLEDQILIKFAEPCQLSQLPPSLHLPLNLPRGKCRELEDQRQYAATRAESFVAQCDFLCQHRVVAAVFSGCVAFESSAPFASAAKMILANARTIVIVHNRDYVVNLVLWFQSVEDLILHHDLRLQTLPDDWRRDSRQSQLKRLLGSAPAIGKDSLFIVAEALRELVFCCPQLREVQTPLHDLLEPGDPLLNMVLTRHTSFLTSPSLALGLSFDCFRGGKTIVDISSDVTPDVMDRASDLFTSVRHLEVTTRHMDSVPKIRNFSGVTDLSLRYENYPLPFHCLLEGGLTNLRLKHLSLCGVSHISLSAISRHWPTLESLSLFNCALVIEEPKLPPASLGSLLSLRLWHGKSGEQFHKRAMNALLKATTRLTTLHLDGAVLCALFLARCSEEPLPYLERLTLDAGRVPALKVTPDDMQCLIGALPSLRCVVTDSSDFRLFFEQCLPAVKLTWCHCTTCAAEFPFINRAQNLFWTTHIA